MIDTNPCPLGDLMTIVWQKKSRYALVTCINNGRGVIVVKEIAPEKVNSGNARWVNETSAYFRNRLRELGVLLAEPYKLEEKDGKAVQTSPYVGLDLSKAFERSAAGTEVLEGIFATIRGVLVQEGREVGIDARLSNFCLGPDGRVYYVDTFPPLVRYDGEYLVHFPNPTDPVMVEQELQRKFDALGILRRLRFSILQHGMFEDEHIIAAANNVVGADFGRKARDLFSTFADKQNPVAAVAGMTLEDPDAIRELALRFMPPRGEMRDQYFETIFDLSSHFCPLKITEEERIRRIRELFAQK